MNNTKNCANISYMNNRFQYFIIHIIFDLVSFDVNILLIRTIVHYNDFILFTMPVMDYFRGRIYDFAAMGALLCPLFLYLGI